MEANDTNRPLTEVNADNMPETSVTTNEANNNKAVHNTKRTKEDIVARLKEISLDPCNADKQEIDSLKQSFYKMLHAEQDAAYKAYIEAGGAAEDYTVKAEPLEGAMKEEMAQIKEKRNSIAAEQEQIKEENLQKKLAILERMKELTENQGDTNSIYNEFKQLQQEWNDIKLVPANKANE